MQKLILWTCLVGVGLGLPVVACESCKSNAGDVATGGTVGLSAGTGDPKYKWALNTSFEYHSFDTISAQKANAIIDADRDTHAHRDEWIVTEHLSYNINPDVVVGMSQGYRFLRLLEIDDPARLGHHESSSGIDDLDFDFKYRFKSQEVNVFPVDLALFGSAKAPTGPTHRHHSNGELFEAEEQPGSGSWDGTLGIAASRTWGPWGASGSISYTYKEEGTQHFKSGNATRLTLSASKLMTPQDCGWKLYLSNGLQGIIEEKAEHHGMKSPDHGGQSIYVTPGIAIKPMDRLTLSTSASVPLYDEQNGFHQHTNWGVKFGIGVKF